MISCGICDNNKNLNVRKIIEIEMCNINEVYLLLKKKNIEVYVKV